MLAAIGAAPIDELFADVPEGAAARAQAARPAAPASPSRRCTRTCATSPRRTSRRRTRSRSSARGCTTTTCPAIVDAIITRSEFLTPYTPYQPEISQGGLQVMFEYQTRDLRADRPRVSNAERLRGPERARRRRLPRPSSTRPRRTRFLVSRGVHPHSRETLATHERGVDARSRRSRSPDGGDRRAGARRRAGRQRLRRLPAVPQLPRHRRGPRRRSCPPPRRPARSWSSSATRSRSGSSPPGDFGVDVAVGEGQSLGNRLDFGGPSFGFFAAQDAYIRRMPGRIAGETTDVDGRRGFVPHARRRASSTSGARRRRTTSARRRRSTRCAGMIHLSWLGREGLVELGELLLQRTRLRARALRRSTASSCCTSSPSCGEFAVTLGRRRRRRDRALRRRGRQPRLPARARLPRARQRAARGHHRAARQADIDRLARRSQPRSARWCTRDAAPRPRSSATARARSSREPPRPPCDRRPPDAGRSRREVLRPRPLPPHRAGADARALRARGRPALHAPLDDATSTSTAACIRSAVHDEAQPSREREGRARCRTSRACIRYCARALRRAHSR